MAKEVDNRKFWLVEFPTYKYKEDVKALARAAGLRIRDARFKSQTDPRFIATEIPTLTANPEYNKKKK